MCLVTKFEMSVFKSEDNDNMWFFGIYF